MHGGPTPGGSRRGQEPPGGRRHIGEERSAHKAAELAPWRVNKQEDPTYVVRNEADVFICYSHEDRELVQSLAESLQVEGFSVWWDPNIGGGAEFAHAIERELSDAETVVVAWSSASIGQAFGARYVIEGSVRKMGKRACGGAVRQR